MFVPWVTIPADDIRIQLPLSICDGDIKLMFRNVEVIDKTIAQLQNVRELLQEKESHE